MAIGHPWHQCIVAKGKEEGREGRREQLKFWVTRKIPAIFLPRNDGKDWELRRTSCLAARKLACSSQVSESIPKTLFCWIAIRFLRATWIAVSLKLLGFSDICNQVGFTKQSWCQLSCSSLSSLEVYPISFFFCISIFFEELHEFPCQYNVGF